MNLVNAGVLEPGAFSDLRHQADPAPAILRLPPDSSGVEMKDNATVDIVHSQNRRRGPLHVFSAAHPLGRVLGQADALSGRDLGSADNGETIDVLLGF